jgi:hypothetical protein
VVGLRPEIVAIAFFIGRTWDYVNDPLFLTLIFGHFFWDKRNRKFVLYRPKDFIKRCVAGPGQTVEIQNKQVFVDGVKFPDAPAGKYTSTENCRWFEGGFAVVCHSEGKGPMGAMKGLSIMSYSPDEKVYTYYETDNSGVTMTRFLSSFSLFM